jgi:hypothetical protein
VKIFYSDHFHFPLPADHRFPLEEYSFAKRENSRRMASAVGIIFVTLMGVDFGLDFIPKSSYLNFLLSITGGL